MLVLGISGSPRRHGNTEILLDEALAGGREAGAETEKIILSGLHYLPCLACGACEKTGNCIQNDDMQEVYEKLTGADVLLFSSPIYFYAVSAWAKAAIDRSQALWSRKYVLKDLRYAFPKKAYFIAVGASQGQRLFDGAVLTMKYFYDAAGFKSAGELLVRGVDQKADILNHPEYLQSARKLGQEAAGKSTANFYGIVREE